MGYKIYSENSHTITSDFEAPFNIYSEFKYYTKRLIVDIFIGIPVLFFVLLLYFFRAYLKKRSRSKILLGTVPIIIFKTYNDFLKKNFDTTLFVLKDWSNGSFHNGISLEDIAPKFIARRPFLLGNYYGFIWALCNFEVYFLYFDSGFLERTIWWRLEPIIYQIFNKKIILFPYGSDVWNIHDMRNLKKKYGLTLFNKKYFNMDFKRKKRNI